MRRSPPWTTCFSCNLHHNKEIQLNLQTLATVFLQNASTSSSLALCFLEGMGVWVGVGVGLWVVYSSPTACRSTLGDVPP